jgi:hypothetical protein
MTPLRLRNFSEHTVAAYVRAVAHFARHQRRSPEQLGGEQVRQYLLYLVQERKVSGSLYNHQRKRTSGRGSEAIFVDPMHHKEDFDAIGRELAYDPLIAPPLSPPPDRLPRAAGRDGQTERGESPGLARQRQYCRRAKARRGGK